MNDVVIVGGGPAGSTCAGFLKKYGPDLRVVLLERERFPRDHVGESLLPPTSRILAELGCWDAIEAANFPIKIGATYRWGRTPELWDFEFFPGDLFKEEPRPAAFAGQRQFTAFQVDRSIYDDILLKHSRSLGAQVHEGKRALRVHREEDRVTGIELETGEVFKGKYYVDATGHSGLIRRALGVNAEEATSLQNVAFWDYWRNADWAVEIGVGGTRVQVMSIGYGWIWFIPLGPTRTSIGLVMPVAHYKKMGKRPEDLYREALCSEARIQKLLQNAHSENQLQTTKDWSFVAERHCGENWFLAGESGGFADPILAAGVTMTHYTAKECALTILELLRGRQDQAWLKQEYNARQKARVRSHIRFADYWYTANEQFTDLKTFTARIASENGLELSPDKAWAWLAQGGFIDNDASLGPAGFSIDQVKTLGDFLAEVKKDSLLKTCNVFRLDLDGAEWQPRAQYGNGRVLQTGCFIRNGRILPVVGLFEFMLTLLRQASTTSEIAARLKNLIAQKPGDEGFLREYVGRVPHALEAMASDGWIRAGYDPNSELRDLPETVARIVKWNSQGA